MAMISAASTVLALQLSIMVGGGVTVTFALGLGTGIGLGLHEGCHVASLRGVPSALVLRGRRTFVLHAPVGAGRRALVAVAGPVVVTLLGVALAGGGSVLASPCLVILGLPLAAHALALTVVGGDGRVACGI
jgi:hypothetical protein